MPDFLWRGEPSDHEDFVTILAHRFPAIVAGFDHAKRELLHLGMAAFARATSAAIESDRTAEVQAHLEFADELFAGASGELDKALYVSYLRECFVGETRDRYIAASVGLPPGLSQALEALKEHWRQIRKAASKRTS